ncbi:MAG: hypothetical protein ABSF64_13225 [Bryobacteraceae bacterium]|jgi:hypothetical protein
MAASLISYPIPTPHSAPQGIAAGPEGALWFTDSLSHTIGRIGTGGTIANYPAPPINFENTGTTGIALGPDSALWFTEFGAGMAGEAVFLSANLIAGRTGGHLGPGADGTSLSFSGTMFGPDEDVKTYQNGIGSAVPTFGTTDFTGSFGSTVTIAELPPTPFGYRIFPGAGATSGKIGAASFSITSALDSSPDFGPPGATFTVSGYWVRGLRYRADLFWECAYFPRHRGCRRNGQLHQPRLHRPGKRHSRRKPR